MPITGTPCAVGDISQAPPAQIACDEQNRLRPQVSRYYDKLVLRRMRSVRLRQGQQAQIQWQILDENGFPVDLTGCGFPDASSSSSSMLSVSSYSSSSSAGGAVGFRVRIRENLSLGVGVGPNAEFPVALVNAQEGRIAITLPATATGLPGVYFAEIGVFDNFDTDAEVMLFSNVFYVIIERGQFGAVDHRGGPPTIMEVRLHLRDSGPEESLLLDNLKFDDAEIALAISRPLDYWNEIPPPVGPRMTTQTFPFRYHWLEAICANLFWMAAENFRANNLTYSAAGIQVDDQNKEQNYEQAAARRDANWKQFVRHKKAQINLDGAYGGIGSDYRYIDWGF